MRRNSTTIFIESLNSITAVPWRNNAPDFAGIAEPTLSILQAAWQAFVASGDELVVIPDPMPTPPQPDWDGLLNAILGGDLFAIYSRLTTANFINPAVATSQAIANANNIAVASGKLDQAVQVTKVEGAVQAAFQMLVTTSDYRFTAEEKALWDGTVADLNFSSAMYLP